VQSASEPEQPPSLEEHSSPRCSVTNVEPLCALAAQDAPEQPPAVIVDNARGLPGDADLMHSHLADSLRAVGCDVVHRMHSGGIAGAIQLPTTDKNSSCADESVMSRSLTKQRDSNVENLEHAAGLKSLEEQLHGTKASLARGFEEVLFVLASHTRQLEQLYVDRSTAGRASATAVQAEEGSTEPQPVNVRLRQLDDSAPSAMKMVIPQVPAAKHSPAGCGDGAAGPTAGSRAGRPGPGCGGAMPAGAKGALNNRRVLHRSSQQRDSMLRLNEALTPRGVATHRVPSQRGSRASGSSNGSRHCDTPKSSGTLSPSFGEEGGSCKASKRQFFV